MGYELADHDDAAFNVGMNGIGCVACEDTTDSE